MAKGHLTDNEYDGDRAFLLARPVSWMCRRAAWFKLIGVSRIPNAGKMRGRRNCVFIERASPTA